MEVKQAEELSKMLSTLDGVMKAKVILDPESGELTEVHILAYGDKNPKQIVRDIETAILTISGERIDRRIISIAQMGGEGQTEDNTPGFKVQSAGLSEDGMEIEISVGITMGISSKDSKKRGIKSFKNVLKLSAEATMEAMENVAESKLKFSLDEIREVTIEDRKFFIGIMTVISSLGMTKELVFSGKIEFNSVKDIAEAIIEKINSSGLKF
jgi:copper chaperone CopZ